MKPFKTTVMITNAPDQPKETFEIQLKHKDDSNFLKKLNEYQRMIELLSLNEHLTQALLSNNEQ